jgi:branched-chain amino acid transport system permease protein
MPHVTLARKGPMLPAPFGPARHVLRFLLIWVALLAVPRLITSDAILQMINLAFIYAIAALGLNIVFGLGGLLSIAQAAFMGIGAYALVFILGDRIGAPVAMGLACLLAAAISGLVGLASARTRSHYFVILTLALADAAMLLVQNNPDVTGGSDGLPVQGSGAILGFDLGTSQGLYVWAAPLLLVCWYLADAYRRSRAGLALRALAVDEHLAIASGIATGRSRFLATLIGGGFAGLAGALLALADSYVGPQNFDIDTAALLLLITVLGGPGSNAGTMLAAVILTVLLQGTLMLTAIGQLIYGLAIIVLIVVAPGGLAGLADMLKSKLAGRRTTAPFGSG